MRIVEELLRARRVPRGRERARGERERRSVVRERAGAADERQRRVDDFTGEVELDRFAPPFLRRLQEAQDRGEDHRKASDRTIPAPSRIHTRRSAGPAGSSSTRPDGQAIRIAA